MMYVRIEMSFCIFNLLSILFCTVSKCYEEEKKLYIFRENKSKCVVFFSHKITNNGNYDAVRWTYLFANAFVRLNFFFSFIIILFLFGDIKLTCIQTDFNNTQRLKLVLKPFCPLVIKFYDPIYLWRLSMMPLEQRTLFM